MAHELGHQWSATHTFNGSAGSCGGNRTSSTAYEPGSGTTIMGYAGICGSQNVQNNSDDHFHGASYDQIIAYSTLGAGNSCAQIVNTGNTPPVADAGDDYTIPADTPFMLTGSGTDANGDDVLSYNWEQFNLGPAGSINNPSEPPHFRSFPSKAEPVRLFPQISDILNDTSTLGEQLPSATDTLNFRLTVRDNRVNGGGVDFDTMRLDVANTAGPFAVTETDWGKHMGGFGDRCRKTGDVAGTDSAPVNCSQVDIALSTDGGNTFDQNLAINVPNDGAETVSVPNVTSTQARVRVMCSDNVFFNISEGDFEITAAATPTFALVVNPSAQDVCEPDNAVIDIFTQSILSFNDPITLSVAGEPAGTTAVFGQTPLTPGQDTTLTISDTDNATPDMYTMTIMGTAGAEVRTATSLITLLPSMIAAPALVQPADGALSVSVLPTFTWERVDHGTSYQFELATDIGFSNIVYSTTTTSLEATLPAELTAATMHYWRVTAAGVCDETTSTIYQMTTAVAPGACAPNQMTMTAFSDDFESGIGDWTHEGLQDTWTLSNANPFSGNVSWFAENLDSDSDQRLISPAIAVPIGENVTLQFQNRQFFEPPDSDGSCYDAGILEISTDNGVNWSYVSNSLLLAEADPYDDVLWNDAPGNNPISVDYGAVDVWCDPDQAYRNAVVDLSDYEGQTVRFRWRLGTDFIIGAEGWYIDDVRVQSCGASPYAVTSDAQSAATAAVGTTITHTVNLTNVGSMTDTYDLTISGETWGTAVSPTSIQLSPTMSGTVEITVTAPNDAVGQVDTATLTITSQGNAGVSSVTSIVTNGYDPAGMTLSAPLVSMTAQAGELVTYAVVIRNETGLMDTVMLDVMGTAAGNVNPANVTLDVEESRMVEVVIAVPPDASIDDSYVNTIALTPTNTLLEPTDLTLTTHITASRFAFYLPMITRP